MLHRALALALATLLVPGLAVAGDPTPRPDPADPDPSEAEPAPPPSAEAARALPNVVFGLTGDDDTDAQVAVPMLCWDGSAWLAPEPCLDLLASVGEVETRTGERLKVRGRGGDEDRGNLGLLVDPSEAWSGVATLPGAGALIAEGQCRRIGDGFAPTPGGIAEGLRLPRKVAKTVRFKDAVDAEFETQVQDALRAGEWTVERAVEGPLVEATSRGALVAAAFTDDALEYVHPLLWVVDDTVTLVAMASEERSLVDGDDDPYYLGECFDPNGDGAMELILAFGHETMRGTVGMRFTGKALERIGGSIYFGD